MKRKLLQARATTVPHKSTIMNMSQISCKKKRHSWLQGSIVRLGGYDKCGEELQDWGVGA